MNRNTVEIILANNPKLKEEVQIKKNGLYHLNATLLERRLEFHDRVLNETLEMFFYFSNNTPVIELARRIAKFYGKEDDRGFVDSFNQFLFTSLFKEKSTASILTKQKIHNRLWLTFRAFRAMLMQEVRERKNEIENIKINCKKGYLRKHTALYRFYLEYTLDKWAGLV